MYATENLYFSMADEGKMLEVRVIDMIVAERKNKVVLDNFDRFGEAMSDGRLTESSDEKVYRLREAILLSKQLRRPLTQEEMKKFEV